MSEPLLRVRHLVKEFKVKAPPPAPGSNGNRRGRWLGRWVQREKKQVFRAVDDVSFDLMPGQTLGIVGESGSGKTTVARCILRAIEPTSGSARLTLASGEQVELFTAPGGRLKALRRDMQMIFQDPFSSLNPRMTVGDIVGEPLLIHRLGNASERRDKVAAILKRVGLTTGHMNRYPHAFSGGQRQRIGIARALILQPRLVVADESVSALDVSVQAQVLELLKDLQRELGLTYIFVSHDLSVVRHVCDDIAVMYRGRVMEHGRAADVFDTPRHAYTRVLLSAIPFPDPRRKMNPLRVSDLTPEQLEPLPQAALR